MISPSLEVQCTHCGACVLALEYYEHRARECSGRPVAAPVGLVHALNRIALELEIANVLKHGTPAQLEEAESRRLLVKNGTLEVSRNG